MPMPVKNPFQVQPWAQRLPQPQFEYNSSPWQPAVPNYGGPGQVWNPDDLAGRKPHQIDEHGRYQYRDLPGMWFQAAPPQSMPVEDEQTRANRALADALRDMGNGAPVPGLGPNPFE